MLLALTRSSKSHEIYCVDDIRYLIKRCSDFTFHYSKVTTAAKKRQIRPPLLYMNFNSNRNLRDCYFIGQYIQKTQNIRNGENQLLLGTISSDKAISTQTMSRWLVHVLTFAGIDTSTVQVIQQEKLHLLKLRYLMFQLRKHWKEDIVKKFTFQKYYCKEIME